MRDAQGKVCFKMPRSQGARQEEGHLQAGCCRTKSDPGKSGMEDRKDSEDCLSSHSGSLVGQRVTQKNGEGLKVKEG